MKNKILSYLFGGLLVVLLNFSYGYVNADCADQCKNTSGPTEYTTCMANCNQQQQEGGDGGSKCNGIKLNTNFPIIGNCIGTNKTNATNVFPTMIGALTKIVMSLILIVCFILIIWAGIMRASAKEDAGQTKKAKELIIRVGVTILLLGFSGVILRLINPNFFS